jgi:hypothetical protein
VNKAVIEVLDAVGVAPTENQCGNEQGCVIPVEKPLLGHHLRPFQPQILYSMGSRKRPGANLLVIGYGGGHKGDDIRNIRRPIGFLEGEMLNNSLSFQRTPAPVPMGSFHCFLFL